MRLLPRLTWILLAMSTACSSGAGKGDANASSPLGPAAPPSEPAAPASEPAAPAAGALLIAAAADQTCQSDADCVLATTFRCCGDCAATPPFKPVTRATNEAARKHDEAQCATEDHDCARHRCPPMPPACTAQPVCDGGRCAALVATACGQTPE